MPPHLLKMIAQQKYERFINYNNNELIAVTSLNFIITIYTCLSVRILQPTIDHRRILFKVADYHIHIIYPMGIRRANFPNVCYALVLSKAIIQVSK